MRTLKDQSIQDDDWILLRTVEGEPPAFPAIVPHDWWGENRERLARCPGELSVWIDGACDLDALLAQGLLSLPLIAVDFPAFTDGRAYSLARLLRERHSYCGDIRAIGDVLRDQLFFMMRCGITSFAVSEGADEQAMLAAANDFSVRYQAACDESLPLYRRR